MSEARVIRESDIPALVTTILGRVGRVVAPTVVDGKARLARVDSGDRVVIPEVNTVNSIKEFFFPRAERLLAYKKSGREVEVSQAPAHPEPFVIIGVRPCDAASLEIMDKVFNWDGADEGWQARRDAATVVAIACSACDRYCFCTSVGLAPDSRNGADVLLVPTRREAYAVEAVTKKGEEFVETYGGYMKAADKVQTTVVEAPRRSDAAEAGRRLEELFEDDLWKAAAERCLGCGICTYYCPTCHCFDIQDEADGDAGVRVRGWDSCSFALFTKHTSGHNPRPDRPSRWRQRIMHKFSYYVERFGVISCTGCGRCGRLCPVDLGVEDTVRMLPGAGT